MLFYLQVCEAAKMSSPRVRRRGIERLYSAEDEVLDKVVQEV